MTKRKRFRPTPEIDSLTIQSIADEIANCNRITAPNAAELAERRDADRERERRRRERQAAAEQAELEAERVRVAEEAELARQQRRAARVAAAEQARLELAENRQKQQYAAERHRLSLMEREWGMFKAQAAQARFLQQRDEYLADMQQTITNVTKLFSPPAEPVEQLYVTPDEKSPRMGDVNWDPSEMGKAAIRWR